MDDPELNEHMFEPREHLSLSSTLQYDQRGVALPEPIRTSIAMRRSTGIAAIASASGQTGALDPGLMRLSIPKRRHRVRHQSKGRMALSLRATAILDVRGSDFRFMASGV